ncbi:MAG: putative zinc-binding protein [Deltaproteobacteria bacterium]|nr:putative zinc-binding protein [Deltaproteobacteria bacterium]
MGKDCCQPTVTTMILACSGGSNVGQLSNQAAIELTQEGFGKLSCLAGVGAHLSGFIQSAKDIPGLVVIDGCEVGCAKGVLEQAEVPLRGYLVITALGIEKNKDLNLKREEIDRVKEAVRRLQADAGEQGQPEGKGTVTCGCRQTCVPKK